MEADRLYLLTEKASPPSDEWPQLGKTFIIHPGRQVSLGSGWLLDCQEQTGENLLSKARANTDPLTTWLAVDRVDGKLNARTLRTGDRFEPLGMPRQTIKLTDLFVNLKIPKRLREHWPLVCQGKEIAWVVGLRMSEKLKIGAQTMRAVKIIIHKNEGRV